MRDPFKLCLTGRPLDDTEAAAPRTVHVAFEGADLTDLLGGAAGYLAETGFAGRPGQLALVPGAGGVGAAVLVLAGDGASADAASPVGAFAQLATALPDGRWHLDFTRCGDESARDGTLKTLAGHAVLGFCLGAYAFAREREGRALLVAPPETEDSVRLARAIWLGRDLINMPANVLGPVELAERASVALREAGAHVEVIEGARMHAAYPCLSAVAAGSDRPGRVVVARWESPAAGPEAPLISLVGKGVCFDSGGYDIKPSSAMLRMKKDMGGAALMLAVALVTIGRDLPIRLELRLGCVENSISGHAMRPGDVLETRAGLSVEIGNTDAEGRLVLCDLITEACEAAPAILIDAATLTGAARVALGPDLPALFSNDDGLCEALLAAGRRHDDELWRLPLWHAYDAWLDRNAADLANVSEKPMAGAITAALFLQRFVKSSIKWAHIDTYAWNDVARPGRPAGGETLGLQAISGALRVVTSEITAKTLQD